MIRFLLLLLVLWVIVKILRSLVSQAPRRPRPGSARPGRRVSGGELVQDPQCGVYIPRETAVRGTGGHSFCSEACRDAFAKTRA